jgi:hypothetical protein
MKVNFSASRMSLASTSMVGPLPPVGKLDEPSTVGK